MAHIIAPLLMLPRPLIRTLINGRVLWEYQSNPEVAKFLIHNYDVNSRQPASYYQELTDYQGEPPDYEDAARILQKLKIYQEPQTYADCDQIAEIDRYQGAQNRPKECFRSQTDRRYVSDSDGKLVRERIKNLKLFIMLNQQRLEMRRDWEKPSSNGSLVTAWNHGGYARSPLSRLTDSLSESLGHVH